MQDLQGPFGVGGGAMGLQTRRWMQFRSLGKGIVEICVWKDLIYDLEKEEIIWV